MSSKSENRLIVHRFPLPKKVEELLGTIQALINRGGVVKLELLFEDSLIRTTETVTGDVPLEDETNWDGALRNVGEMEEYYSPGAESFQVVVDMMHIVAHSHRYPAQWVIGVGGEALINKWLELDERGMPGGNGQILGVPLLELKSLPEETLILCGSKYPNAGPDEISFAVKTAVELGNNHVNNGETDGRGRGNTSQRTAATGSMETASTELRIPKWSLAH